MDNGDIAAQFNEMADLLDIQGGDRYRIRAFRRIARVLENLRQPVTSMIRQGTLARTPGIGEGALGRIKEIARTGTCAEYRHLSAALPAGLRELMKVKGIGVKSVRHLWANERISSVAELEEAVRSGRIGRLPGFGEDRDKILAAIARYRREAGRLLLPEAVRIGGAMVEALQADPTVVAAQLTGSARRRKETVGDLDVLVASHDPVSVIARFVVLPGIDEVLVRGDSKSSALVKTGQQVDVRVIPPESFGAGLHYFTGSQQHNIYIRARGNRRGIKISEHGVFRRMDEKLVDTCEAEEAIFTAVGLPFIPPELRENTGEIEAAASGKLPRLITEPQVLGDVHVYSGTGARAMLEAAAELNLKWVAFTDRAAEVRPDTGRADRLRAAAKGLGVGALAGIEVEILPGGTLDVEPPALVDYDFVLASIRTGPSRPANEQTARIIHAMETGVVDCIAHPAGRVFGEEDGSTLDLEVLFRAARRLDVALEIHGDPRRLDLDSTSCRYARETGVEIAIGSGAREPRELGEHRRWGVAVARRGWLEAKDVLSAKPAAAVLQRRRDRLRKRGVQVPEALHFDPAAAAEPMAANTFEKDRIDALEEELRKPRLAVEVLERLEEFFRSGADELLEQALARIGEGRPPLQKAYDLILANETQADAAAALQEEPGHEPAATDTGPAPARTPARKRTPTKAKPKKPRRSRS